MHRVIFDRSIFHGDNFRIIKESPIRYCLDRNLIKVIYTSQFIEETLRFCLYDQNAFKIQWDFLVELNSKKWFRHAEHIVATELGNAIVGRKYYFLSSDEICRVVENSYKFAKDLVPTAELALAIKEMEHNKTVREDFRTTRLDVRASVPLEKYDFKAYVEENVEWYIVNGLMTFHDNSAGFLDTWKTRRHKCRFTQSFIRGWFSTIYLPIVNHNLKVDINDRPDAEQLAFLEWSDIIVSNDTKFMKEAFTLLYHDTQKQFMSLSGFLFFLNSIAATSTNKRQNGARSSV